MIKKIADTSLNHFLIRLKPVLPILLFVFFFQQYVLLFPKHEFLNAHKMECYLIMLKILKTKDHVNFIFMLPVIFMVPNLFKK